MTEIYEKHGWDVLTGDVNYIEHGGTFIYQRPTHVGLEDEEMLPTYILLKFIGCSDTPDEKLWVEMTLCCPGAVGKEEREAALQSCGWDGVEDWLEGEDGYKGWVELLDSYGISAPLSLGSITRGGLVNLFKSHLMTSPTRACEFDAEWAEENEEKIFECAAMEAQGLSFTVGFQLDQRCNAMGNNGWDFLTGTYGW